jgi:hypothetical protein
MRRAKKNKLKAFRLELRCHCRIFSKFVCMEAEPVQAPRGRRLPIALGDTHERIEEILLENRVVDGGNQ